MQRAKTKLFCILFIGFLLFFNVSALLAQSLTSHQPVIPLSQMDAGSLILTVSPAEFFSIAPVLAIPEQDQGKMVTLFAMVLHKDWVILMTESGWKPYSGDITMFGQVKLQGKSLEPFTLDGSRLISSVGDSIDIFYGYEIEETVFLANAAHFQKSKDNNLKQDIFKIAQPSNSLENLTPEKLPLNLIPDNCQIVSPHLEIADIDVGNKAQIFAAILAKNYIFVKTQSGWEFYDGGEIKPFKSVVLTKELQEFDIPLPSDYYGEVFYYYAYSLNRKSIVGNAMRVNVAD